MATPTTKLTAWRMPAYSAIEVAPWTTFTNTATILAADATATTFVLGCPEDEVCASSATLTIGAWAQITAAPSGDGAYGFLESVTTNMNMQGTGTDLATGYFTVKCDIRAVSTVLRCTEMLTLDFTTSTGVNPNYISTITDPYEVGWQMATAPFVIASGLEKLSVMPEALSTTWGGVAVVPSWAAGSGRGESTATMTSTAAVATATTTHKSAAKKTGVGLMSIGLTAMLAGWMLA